MTDLIISALPAATVGVKPLVDLLNAWVTLAHHCSIKDAFCCCGEEMEGHSNPMNCGHLPVDHGTYTATELVKRTLAALTPTPVADSQPADPVVNDPAVTVERPNCETFDAMCAMRNAINEYVPMPSIESDLLQGPENSVFCATVAEAVIVEIKRLLDLQANSKAPPAAIREAALVSAVAKQIGEEHGWVRQERLDEALAKLAHLAIDTRIFRLSVEALSEIKAVVDGQSEQSVKAIIYDLLAELEGKDDA